MNTVGQILKKARLTQNKTLHDIASATYIKESYLADIEDDNWAHFSSPTYISGAIEQYANVVGEDPQKLRAYFRRDYEHKQELEFQKDIPIPTLWTRVRFSSFILISVILVLFVSYFSWQIYLYLKPPSITITAPVREEFRLEGKVPFAGKVDRESQVVVDGNRVSIDENGLFSTDIILKKGKNTISVEVTGPNGKKVTIEKVYTVL